MNQNQETNDASLAQHPWQGNQLGEERYQKIKEGIAGLKKLIEAHSNDEEPEDTILLDAIADVLESLERTFINHFQTKSGHIVSPKSDEPWD